MIDQSVLQQIIEMDKGQQETHQHINSENADLNHILDLFDSEQLNLTIIKEDTQQNERSSSLSYKRSGDSLDIKQEISDAKYRLAFLKFFKNYRSAAVSFIDTAIRFMNGIKKMKMDDLIKYLNDQDVMGKITEALICPELLIQPMEDDLVYRDLNEADTARYEEVLTILRKANGIGSEDKIKVMNLLSQIESH